MATMTIRKVYSGTIEPFGTSGTYSQVGATSGSTGWTFGAVQETQSSGMVGTYIVADTCFGQVSAGDALLGIFGGFTSGSIDDEPMHIMSVPRPSDSGYVQVSFAVPDLAYWRIGMATVSSSDLFTKAWVTAQNWRFQSSS